MAALTLTEVKNYLRVDFDEDDSMISGLMGAADSYLKGSIGINYDEEDERVKTLLLLYIADLYNNRELSDKASTNTRRLVEDFSLQMRLEMRA